MGEFDGPNRIATVSFGMTRTLDGHVQAHDEGLFQPHLKPWSLLLFQETTTGAFIKLDIYLT